MASGKKTSRENIYKVMSLYFTTNNYNDTAKQLGMPYSTVRDIVLANKDKEKFIKLKNQKKEEFITKADKIIEKAMNKLYDELDKEGIAINHLSTVIGTLYDKKALAKGESTVNENITIKVDLVED